ncbi:uncharacterized protein [Clytia hemisphaerica]|uniref:RRM domain-containing protein n=1 Tax=Clytia hemisphaerica TaxID=252671 RepID=A0A7M5UML8_9CNID
MASESDVTQGSPPVPYSFIPSESEQENPNKLFLGGVSAETTEKQLEDFFLQFGKVKDVRIVTDRVTAACKGYGFVTFEDDEDVDHLVERKTIRMNGTKLRVRRAIRRNASQFEHVSPSKKWLMASSNLLTTTPSTPFLTPPNTPPSPLEQLDLSSLNLKSHIPGTRFYFNGKESMDGYPVLITHGGGAAAAARSRTNSSPVQPPSIIIPEDDPAFFFPQQIPQAIMPAPQHSNRDRTYSSPITLQDYETIQQQQQQAFLQDQQRRSVVPTQTLLMTTDQAPSKFMTASTSTVYRTHPPPPQCRHAPVHHSQPQTATALPTNQGYMIPFYSQQPQPNSGGTNLLYCLPPQSRHTTGAPQQVLAPQPATQFHSVQTHQPNMYK